MRNVLATVIAATVAVAANAATFVVSNTANSGLGSLQQAIADANAAPGLDTIDFSIGTGPRTIGVIPPLVITSPLIIDGSTQEGFSGTPLITVVGSGLGDGLEFAAGADGSAVRNLEMGNFFGVGFFDAASIAITGANNVTVAGNYLGGVRDFALRSRAGIRILTANNTIGGLTAAERNVGVNETTEVLMMPTATNNVVQGNYFGFDPTGLIPRFPATSGVTIDGGSNNVVGGVLPGARNVIITSLVCISIGNDARDNRVEGNYLGLGANGLPAAPHLPSTVGVNLSSTGGGNIIGGIAAEERNVISNNHQGIGISLQAAAGDLILGNFIGTDPTGLTAVPNDIGIVIGFALGPDPIVIGGLAPGEGNLISGNTQVGIFNDAHTAIVLGNSIGTDVTGLAALPNGSGIHLSSGAVIGDGSTTGRNVISGNTGDGIESSGATFLVTHAITGNYIGVGADGVTPLPNGGNGIEVDSNTNFGSSGPIIRSNVIAHNALAGIHLANATDSVVGGSVVNVNTKNTIFSNQGDGVSITGSSIRNVVKSNSIDNNAGLGIDLADDGVTANDAADVDTGPNTRQNYPTLVRAIVGAGQTIVTGTLSSTPNAFFTIDFYTSPSADPSNFGEGALQLATSVVMTDPAGQATINATIPAAGVVITATATAVANGTSEFSNAVVAEPAGTIQFSAPSYLAQEGSIATITVTRLGGSAGTVTVDFATADGTAIAGADYTATNGTLTFVDGQTTATFTITIAHEGTTEGDETVQLTLSNPTAGATLGNPSQATLTITDLSVVPTLGELAAIVLFALLALIAMRSLRMT